MSDSSFFSNNRLVCNNCGINDNEAIYTIDVIDEDKRYYVCELCGYSIRSIPLSSIIINQGKGGIDKK